jgi:hypothetical protein
MSPRVVQAAVSRMGGISRGNYLRDGMRPGSQQAANQAFSGVTASHATAIATGHRDVAKSDYGSGRLPPIRIAIERDRNGKDNIILQDGRHRMTAARAAGATHIRASVSRAYQNARGQWVEKKPVEVIVKL